jgi:putative transposase
VAWEISESWVSWFCIELNPVRAAMVGAPSDYRWSSYACNAQGSFDPLVAPHPAYVRIHPDPESRQTSYRELVTQGISDDELAVIRTYAQRQRALGTSKFPQTSTSTARTSLDIGG